VSPGNKSCINWGKAVEEATKGKVKVTIYGANTLATGFAAYDAVLSGVADVAWGFIGFFPGRFPLSDLLSQPAIGVPNAMAGSLAMWNNYQKFPEMRAEYKDVKLLLVHTHQGAPIGTRKVAIRTFEDLKGLKIRSPAGGALEFLKAAGASPIMMPPFDIYTSMEKGVLDGWTIDLIGAEGFGLHEVTDFYTGPNYYVGTFWLVMNQSKWDSLPADIQKAIDSVSGEWGVKNLFAATWDTGEEEAKARMMTPEQYIVLPDEEWAKCVELSESVWEAEIARLEAKGLPAQAVFDETLQFVKAYK